jgi:pimeloyl-ACP methyl ester carboxylesterase
VSATPVVAVPGLGLGPESWAACLAALQVGPTRVQLLPGYGVPTARRGAPPPRALAEALCQRLVEPTVVLGHSASCQVVAHAATICPELVPRIVLVAPSTDPRARSWWRLAELWLRNAVHEDPRQVPLLLRQYQRTTLRSMHATMDAARHDDIAATLSSVRCPVVLVRGVRDRIARRDWVSALASTGPETVVVEIPAGAHMVPQTHPRLVAEQVRRLLS